MQRGGERNGRRTPGQTTWRLTIEYDGTRYSGWQEQKNARTVMGALRSAAEEVLGVPVDLQGAGRTDAGVHALAQVAQMRANPERPMHPEQMRRAFNTVLPSDICVLEIAAATGGFHARHDAVRRTYLYQISTRRSAFLKKYVWWVKESLDTAAMAQAAQMLVGRHDFAAFRAVDEAHADASTIVVVEAATIELDGDLILFRITASHYLWRMVRRVVGVLVKIGLGELKPEDMPALLKGRAGLGMDIAAWTAPASGLFLESVEYAEARPERGAHTRRFTSRR